MNTPIHILKLGGSLLDLPDLPRRVQSVLAASPFACKAIIVGGAAAANIIRRFDALFNLDETAAHWLAIRAMQLNAHVIAHLLPATQLAGHRDDCLDAWSLNHTAIIDPLAWLKHDEQHGITIPHRWTFTSDSIAAHIATRVAATRLTMLKSTLAADDQEQTANSNSTDSNTSNPHATHASLLDSDFPAASRTIPHIDLINLRHGSPEAGPLDPLAARWLRGGPQ